nr:MATE family efflux transporter [Halogeometricum sp. CBA1124]
MYVRLLTLPTNVALNAVLIFGLFGAPALGVEGAAWGTVAANTLAAVIFFGLLASGRWDVRLRLGGKQWDWGVVAEIVRVGLPLAGTRLSRTFGRFPFLFVLGVLGTDVVAAYAIGRRVMLLALMPAWGYSTAASTLVGQAVGGGDDAEATEYGWQTLRIALVTQLLIAAVIFLAAEPLAQVFGAGNVALTTTFIRVFGLGVAGFSVSRTMRGALRGAGDTRWPFYGGLLGTYVVRLPVAFAALPVGFAVSAFGVTVAPGLGWALPAVYAAILADMSPAPSSTGRGTTAASGFASPGSRTSALRPTERRPDGPDRRGQPTAGSGVDSPRSGRLCPANPSVSTRTRSELECE